jgi:hypothetical protein
VKKKKISLILCCGVKTGSRHVPPQKEGEIGKEKKKDERRIESKDYHRMHAE